MIQLYPAIDLRDGKCVRLSQGDYTRETVYNNTPVDVAQHWVEEGATYLHVIDLDGARKGRPVNTETVKGIVAAADVPVQVGGGIRAIDDIEAMLELGAARVILGSAAVRDLGFVRDACEMFPGRVLVSVDVSVSGHVATDAWLQNSTQHAADFARHLREAGVETIIYTDISRDGMLTGANFDSAAALAQQSGLQVIVAGGVRSLDDVRLAAKRERDGISGLVLGKALYSGDLELAAALAWVSR